MNLLSQILAAGVTLYGVLSWVFFFVCKLGDIWSILSSCNSDIFYIYLMF